MASRLLREGHTADRTLRALTRASFAATALALSLAGCSDQGDAPTPPDLIAPVVSLTAPAGGEVWLVGTVHSITWQASDADTPSDELSVNLDYLADGVTPTVIAAGWPNTGSYEWTIPGAVSSQAKVRIRVSDGRRFGESITPLSFTVLEPPPPGQNLLAVGSASGRVGSGAEVLLSLANENSIARIEADLDYDPAVATFTAATLIDRGIGRNLVADEAVDGALHLEVSTPSGGSAIPAGTGSVVRLSFALSTEGATALTLHDAALFDEKTRALEVVVTDGSIAIGSADTPASLTSLIPARTVRGDTVVVVGTELGDEPAEVRFTANGGTAIAEVIDWSATSARVIVPELAIEGPLLVRKGSTDSNTLAFSVAPALISFAKDLAAPGKPFQRGGCQACHICFEGIGGSGGLCIEDASGGEHVAGILEGGDHGPAIVPRRSAESILVKKLLPSPPFGDRMPVGSALRAEEILAIQDWIDQGARDN